MKRTDVIIVCKSALWIIPGDAEPEEFAGFVDDDVRVYINERGGSIISQKAMEVLNAYEVIFIPFVGGGLYS